MTDENRAELRRVVERMVRLSAAGVGWLCEIEPSKPTLPEDTPPLTTAQQLALSVLLGEPDAATTAALCDLLIEQGHEYAVAVAEKARAEERERVIGHIDRLVSGLTLRMGQYGYSGPNYERASTQAAPLALLKGAVESGRAAT